MDLNKVILEKLSEFKGDIPGIINECTVAGVRLDDGIVLAKNRDRGYTAKVEVIHELVDNVEVLFWRDIDTDWSEGMNEFGIGIVNSSLMVNDDEKEGDKVEKKREEKRIKKVVGDKKGKPKHASDGAKIRQALTQKNLRDCVRVIVTTRGNGSGIKGVTGESIVSDGKDIYIVEHTSQDVPIIKKLKRDRKVAVRTNHGVYHKHVGYLHGEKRKSSVARMETAKEHLESAKTDQDVIDLMRKQYHQDPMLNPYREDNKYHMQTTGQIMMNLDKKIVTVRMDKKHGEFDGVINKLPEGYEPKIKFHLER